MNIRKSVHVALIVGLFITLVGSAFPRVAGTSGFEHGPVHICIICQIDTPAGDDPPDVVADEVTRGYPVSYYGSVNDLPGPQFNRQNISVVFFLIDWFIISLIFFEARKIYRQYLGREK